MEKILKIALMVALLPLFLKAEFVVKSYQEIKNEKVVRQNYEESCGAASLATLINTLDDNNLTELDLLKTMSGQKLYTDMVSFADLNDAVKKLGYESKSYKVDRKILENIISVPIKVIIYKYLIQVMENISVLKENFIVFGIDTIKVDLL